MNREQVRILRRARAECILLGMALARNEDRKYILENCFPGDFQSDIVVSVLQAIREKNAGEVRANLKRWGIDVTDTVSSALVKMVREFGEQERAKEVLSKALITDDYDLKRVLSDAMAELNNREERVDGSAV